MSIPGQSILVPVEICEKPLWTRASKGMVISKETVSAER